MRTWTRALLFCVATTGVATAQPTDEDPLAPADPMPPQPEPPPQPQPPPPPPPEPMPVAAPVAPAEPQAMRPEGMSIGIGAGYLLPDSLETPNITSVRFRLESGLTVEPLVVLSQLLSTVDTGDETTNTSRDLQLGALVRKPMVSRGRYDFEGLGAVFLGASFNLPDVDDADSSTTTVALAYGLSVSTWINAHWQISFSALNPIVSYSRSRQEQGPDQVRVDSNLAIGAIFDPTVTAMVHLYY